MWSHRLRSIWCPWMTTDSSNKFVQSEKIARKRWRNWDATEIADGCQLLVKMQRDNSITLSEG